MPGDISARAAVGGDTGSPGAVVQEWCWAGQSGALIAWAPGGSQGTSLCPGALPRNVPTLELSFLHLVWNSSAMKS